MRGAKTVVFLLATVASLLALQVSSAVLIGKQHLLALRTSEEISLICQRQRVSGSCNNPGTEECRNFAVGNASDNPAAYNNIPTTTLSAKFDSRAPVRHGEYCVNCIYGDSLSVGFGEALKAYLSILFTPFGDQCRNRTIDYRNALCGEHCYAHGQSVVAYGSAKRLRELMCGKQAHCAEENQRQSAGKTVDPNKID